VVPGHHHHHHAGAATRGPRGRAPRRRRSGPGQELRDDVGAGGGDLGGERLVDGDEGELVGRVARGVGGVEAGVAEDRHGEPPRMEQRGELEHRTDVALERQREQHDAPAALLLLSGHGRSPVERAAWLLQ